MCKTIYHLLVTVFFSIWTAVKLLLPTPVHTQSWNVLVNCAGCKLADGLCPSKAGAPAPQLQGHRHIPLLQKAPLPCGTKLLVLWSRWLYRLAFERVKFCQNKAALLCLIIFWLFGATAANEGVGQRLVVRKAENIYSLALYRKKNVPASDLDDSTSLL